jgi:uncharacterized membrane protein
MQDADLFILARALHVLGIVLWIGGVAFVTTVVLLALSLVAVAGGVAGAHGFDFGAR